MQLNNKTDRNTRCWNAVSFPFRRELLAVAVGCFCGSLAYVLFNRKITIYAFWWWVAGDRSKSSMCACMYTISSNRRTIFVGNSIYPKYLISYYSIWCLWCILACISVCLTFYCWFNEAFGRQKGWWAWGGVVTILFIFILLCACVCVCFFPSLLSVSIFNNSNTSINIAWMCACIFYLLIL